MSFLNIALGKITKHYGNIPVVGFDIKIDSQRLGLAIMLGSIPTEPYPKGTMLFFKYENAKNGSKITWCRSDKDRENVWKNQDFATSFFKDFEAILITIRNTDITYLRAQFYEENSVFLAKLGKLFERIPKIRSNVLVVDVSTEEEIIGVLKCLSAETLESINVGTTGDVNITIPIRDVANYEQWIRAKYLEMSEIDVVAAIQKFASFEKAHISFARFLFDSFNDLKEIFSNSPTPQNFHILSVNNMDNITELIENYGPPYVDTTEENRTRKSWFFDIGNHQFLRVSLFAVLMEFQRISREEEVPRSARIITQNYRL